MDLLIVNGLISLNGVNALKAVMGDFKPEKELFCCFQEMEAKLAVEIPEKSEDAMSSNVHVRLPSLLPQKLLKLMCTYNQAEFLLCTI